MEESNRAAVGLSSMPRLRAFTLVELLVVIAVVGVLAALLFPALKAARERSQGAACVGILRQYGNAFALFAAENGGRLPLTRWGVHGETTREWWKQVAPFMDSTESNPKIGSVPAHLACPGRLPSENRSYTCNDRLGGLRLGVAMESPGAWLLMDGSGWDYNNSGGDYTGRVAYARPENAQFRHGGRANVLFPKGHVRTMTPDQVNAELEFFIQNNAKKIP